MVGKTLLPGSWGVAGGEATGLAALGRTGADRGSLPAHGCLSPIWDRFSHPPPQLFPRGFWKRLMDARCQEHNHPEKALKAGRRESWDRRDKEGGLTLLFLAG